jgi:hypothetical protein
MRDPAALHEAERDYQAARQAYRARDQRVHLRAHAFSLHSGQVRAAAAESSASREPEPRSLVAQIFWGYSPNDPFFPWFYLFLPLQIGLMWLAGHEPTLRLFSFRWQALIATLVALVLTILARYSWKCWSEGSPYC